MRKKMSSQQLAEILLTDQQSIDTLAFVPEPLLAWFDENARSMPWRDNPTPYWVWLSEIMLQQTRVEAVRDYFHRFTTQLPTIQALANASEEQVLKLWEGLGYYSRAKNLHKTAKILCSEYDCQLPPEYDALKKLPGIGEYTAGAIASNVFGIAVPAIDGNVYRVISRLIASEAMVRSKAVINRAYFQIVGDMIPPERPGIFNQSLMELGATICIPNGAPLCDSCPVSSFCKAKQLHIQTELPVLPTKRPRTVENRTILLITSPKGVLLTKRPDAGLLASLWEYVNLEEYHSQQEIRSFVDALELEVTALSSLKESVHIFSHIEWHMEGWHVAVKDAPPPAPYQWVESLAQHSVPSAYRAYTNKLPTLSPLFVKE